MPDCIDAVYFVGSRGEPIAWESYLVGYKEVTSFGDGVTEDESVGEGHGDDSILE